ncbi:uncharacterized protein [Amphiura filiformis]|uniref:uncharacterized protein n=1 Tax=Amphiura filiformis TaxID=82378 RepID=UPI003B223E1B
MKTIKGTFRSAKCKHLGFFSDNMCEDCAGIPKLQSFRKRALLRHRTTDNDGNRDISTIRNDMLTNHERSSKLAQQRREIDKKTSQIFFLTSKVARTQIKCRTYKERVVEFSRRGSMKAICHQLQKADAEGKLKDKSVLNGLLEAIGRNLHVEKKGKRYPAPLQTFFEVILMWGGPRLANFVSLNIFGPEIHSMFRWRKQKAFQLLPGIAEENFVKLKSLYADSRERGNIPKVPVLLAEDETAITAHIEYVASNDSLIGFCGENGDGHTCKEDFSIKVGDGEEGYNNIMKSFQDCKIGSMGRAVILNPLHPALPKIPILIHPTCNTFDSGFIRRQWDELQSLYDRHLHDILGPLIGQASDGDARRRSLMVATATNLVEEKYQPIPSEDGFDYTCFKISQEDGSYTLKGLFDQDYIHNHKKMVNHLFHASRDMKMGNFTILSNHLTLVYQLFPFHDHGLLQEDIQRTDRQNWRSAQRVCFLKVQHCLQQVVDGNVDGRVPDHSVKGTLIFLKVVWMYVEVFCSKTASLRDRIMYAATVTHFLTLWRESVIQSKARTLQKNFLSRETFTDIKLSCHFAVSLICFMRDQYPDVDCFLELVGTDLVESFWSKNGQWVGNRHNYTYARLDSNRAHMVRLEQIRVDPQAPEFARPHPKAEMIWPKQYATGFQPANLHDYPEVGDERNAWLEGKAAALELAHEAGLVCDVVGQDVSNQGDEAQLPMVNHDESASNDGDDATSSTGNNTTPCSASASDDSISAGDDITPTCDDSTSAGDDTTPICDDSTSAGDDTTPTSDDSTSAGDDATPTSDDSTSAGDDTTPTSDNSTSAGDDTTPTSDDSTSAGDDATPTSDDSTSAGDDTTPTSDDSTSAGDDTTPTSDDSTSAGDDTTPTSDDSTSAGDDTTPTSDDSTSAGDDTTYCCCDDSTSAGDDTTPTGDGTTSTGDGTTPTGDDPTSSGDDSTPTSDDSTPAGDDSTSAGDDSVAIGDDSTLVSDNLHLDGDLPSVQEIFNNIEFLDNPLDSAETSCERRAPQKYSQKVKVPGKTKEVYKATLVSMLNTNKHLDHDRLRRVRQRQEYDNASVSVQNSVDLVSLFSDYAILKKAQKTFVIGQVIRMVHKGKDFRRPVSYEDSRANNIQVTVNVYTMLSNGVYKKEISDTLIKFNDIIAHVNLEVNVHTGEYQLHCHTLEEINKAVQRLCPTRTAATSAPTVEKQLGSDDGRRLVPVEPVVADDGIRRSRRRRNMIISECW